MRRMPRKDPAPRPPAVIAKTRSLQPRLTPAERSVAKVVLHDPGQAINLGIEALAEQARVSTASVNRFCHQLGFARYKDFRIALAMEVGTGGPVLPTGEVSPKDAPIEIARKVLQADIQAIGETMEMLDAVAFSGAVEALEGARRIEVYGVGSSAPVAADAYYRLLRIGMPVTVVTDAHMQAVSAAMLGGGDLAFVISHTGRTKETLESALQARRAGARVLALTSFAGSAITRVAHLSLVTATTETAFRTEAMASRIAHLSLVDALYVTLATRLGRRSSRALEKSGSIIEAKRQQEP